MEHKEFSRIYYFPFWRKQFFFHKNAGAYSVLLSFYHPYVFLAKVCWFSWVKIPFVKYLFSANSRDLPISVQAFEEILGTTEKWVWVINKGSEGPFQKTTGLFINALRPTEKLFLKYGKSAEAISLIKNEIKVLQQLYDYEFASKIIQYKMDDDMAYFTSTVFTAQKYSGETMNTKLLDFIIKMNAIYPVALNSYDGFYYGFGHGDFCPWNLLTDKENIIVVDWEMGGNYLIGHDLFTFVFQSSFLLHPNRTVEEIYSDNKIWFVLFFNHFAITNYSDYLVKFASVKVQDKTISGSKALLEKYKDLKKLNTV